VYLIRHGQAGTRYAYDMLSETGREQSRLLGRYFRDEGIVFDAAWSGTLNRQIQTAEEVRSEYPQFPAPTPDPGWNEFDLDRVYKELAPALCEEDPEFRREYEEMKAELRAAGDDAPAHRRWNGCDMKMVQAWLQAHPKFTGESWHEFQARVESRRAALAPITQEDDDHNFAVFTSGTPVGIWAGLGMDIADRRALRLAGVIHNASITMVRLRPDQLRLHSFNAVPHLPAALRTYR
jgi:broad specificity phosphatase PhoE